MTEIVTANFHKLEGLKVVFQILKFAAGKWLDFSKQRIALASCRSRLEDCDDACHHCETQRRLLAYVLLLLVGTLLIGSMYYTIAPRPRV